MPANRTSDPLHPGPSAPGSSPGGAFPLQPLLRLDALWIQVAGSRCNLACTHCFVSCGPEAATHGFLSRGEVQGHVAEALSLGAREFYFTGGEPFLHREMEAILADTLEQAPATVLTNGTLFTARRIETLRALSDATRYSLEIRVSLDGLEARAHDRFRGDGSFERSIEGLHRLSDAGLLPIVTATQFEEEDALAFRERWLVMLRAHGLARPRLKVLPLFRLGRETARSRAYLTGESLAGLAPDAFDPHLLQCGTSRAVTSRGAFVCPLLVDEPSARLGERVGDARGPFTLTHGACATCWTTGMTCGNG